MKTPFPKVSGVTPEIRTTKKRFRPYTGTKAFSFCGTTLFGENRPLLSHTIICAPLITDRVPVGSYCSPRRGSEPPSRAHWEFPVLPYFHRRRLSGYTWKFLLFPAQRFSFLLSYSCPSGLSSPRKHFLPFFAGNRQDGQQRHTRQDQNASRRFWPP